MKLMTLVRFRHTDESTIGSLRLWEGTTFTCFTLEDTVREPGVKVKGKTAIPAGEYQVIVNFSDRFQRPMPLLLNVQNFEGVRIHKGNVASQTEGCILLGMSLAGENRIGESKKAFDAFFPILQAALETDKVFIRISKGKEG